MITPTPGRVVWFHPSKTDNTIPHHLAPLAAHIAYVWHDKLVNLMVIDVHGHTHSATSVQLLQDNDMPTGGAYCEWMPYQVGQAKKHEEAKP